MNNSQRKFTRRFPFWFDYLSSTYKHSRMEKPKYIPKFKRDQTADTFVKKVDLKQIRWDEHDPTLFYTWSRDPYAPHGSSKPYEVKNFIGSHSSK